MRFGRDNQASNIYLFPPCWFKKKIWLKYYMLWNIQVSLLKTFWDILWHEPQSTRYFPMEYCYVHVFTHYVQISRDKTSALMCKYLETRLRPFIQ